MENLGGRMMTISELKDKIQELKDAREKLKEEAASLLESDKVDESEAKRDEIKKLDGEIAELEKELKEKEESDESQKDEEENVVEERSISRIEVPEKVTHEEVRAFEKYLETRDIAGGSLTTESRFVDIPEEIVTDILKLKEVEFNLDQYVTVKNVQNGSGKYPVVRQSQVAALPEVEELAANPELAVKPFFQLAYDIKTHRGYFKISRAASEDSKLA